MTGKTVNNSGKGNCMYYAYSISLMYFLLKKREPETAEKIFTRLELTEGQKSQLHALLNDKSLTRFDDDQIEKIIEPILGVATRKIAAEQTKERFIKQAKDTPLFSALNYGMIFLFRRILESQSSPLASLLENASFDDPDYRDDEIFKFLQDNRKTLDELEEFFLLSSFGIIDKLNAEWDERVQKVFKFNKQGLIKITKEEIAKDPFYKQQFLEELIGEKTIEFLTKDANQNINLYAAHLNTNYRWGSEETLLLLHRYVQGEQQVLLAPDKWDFPVETNICLVIYNNGIPKSGDVHKNPDMIVNNLHNAHWVSLVELGEASPSLKKSPLVEIGRVSPPLVDKTDPQVVKTVPLVDKVNLLVDPNSPLVDQTSPLVDRASPLVDQASPLVDQAASPLVDQTSPLVVKISPLVDQASSLVDQASPLAQSKVIASSPSAKSPTELRMQHLTFCGFDTYLKQLENKTREFLSPYPKESAEAFVICHGLNEVRNKFIARQSTMTTKEFSTECQRIIQIAPKTHLQDHRGIGKILNGMMNALIFLANAFIGIGNLFYGKFELIDPNRIQTESIKQVNGIAVSLEALKAIRARDTQKTITERAIETQVLPEPIPVF